MHNYFISKRKWFFNDHTDHFSQPHQKTAVYSSLVNFFKLVDSLLICLVLYDVFILITCTVLHVRKSGPKLTQCSSSVFLSSIQYKKLQSFQLALAPLKINEEDIFNTFLFGKEPSHPPHYIPTHLEINW